MTSAILRFIDDILAPCAFMSFAIFKRLFSVTLNFSRNVTISSFEDKTVERFLSIFSRAVSIFQNDICILAKDFSSCVILASDIKIGKLFSIFPPSPTANPDAYILTFCVPFWTSLYEESSI